MTNANTLRPGLLVGMKTSITGNMKYSSNTLDDRKLNTGEQLTKWETTRTVYDPAEYERAVKVRSKVRGAITSVCADTAFGLLCPDNKVEELNAAIKEARVLADEFNSTAKFTRINFNLMTGRVASDEETSIRAMNREVRDLMADMERGIKDMQPKAIRDAAYKLRMVSQMLTPAAQEKARESLELARAAARKYTKAGETAAAEIDTQAIKAIKERRTYFLDLDDADEVAAPVVAAPRAVDLAPKRLTEKEYKELTKGEAEDYKSTPEAAAAKAVRKRERVRFAEIEL